MYQEHIHMMWKSLYQHYQQYIWYPKHLLNSTLLLHVMYPWRS